MRVVLAGNKNLAINCLRYLLECEEEIVAVIANPEDNPSSKEKTWYPSLKKYAQEQSLPVYQPKHISDPSFAQVLRQLQPDFLFSMSYSRLLRPNVISIPRLGAINIHFSLLPKYQGCLPLVYALADQEKEVGVTIHYIDEGIDSGDIIGQRSVDVEPTDTAHTLYFKCVDLGTSLFQEVYPLLKRGSAGRIPQDQRKATYHPQEYPNDRWIDWRWPLRKIDSFIRAHTFPSYPSARTSLASLEVEVLHPTRCETDAPPDNKRIGQIMGATPREIGIVASDGILWISHLRMEGKEYTALDFTGRFLPT